MSFQNLYGSSSRRRGGRNRFVQRTSSRRNAFRGRSFSQSLRHGEGRVNSYKMDVDDLKNILKKDSYMIPIELLKNTDGYGRLLNDSFIGEEKLLLIIKLLERSALSRVNKVDVIDLFCITFKNPNFCQSLTSFISKMKYETETAEHLQGIASIIAEFLRLSPSTAFPLISSLVDLCNGVVTHIKNEKLLNVDSIEHCFQNIQAIITETRSKIHSQIYSGQTRMIPPPDDFREHKVVPTLADLNDTDKPFLVPNIVKGGYKDTNHYLDIQFRLLKEDFIRPLRLGIQEFKKTNNRIKNVDVRIYSKVFVDSTGFQEEEFVYNLKLNLHSKFKIENSKRLMYGNVLCISTDNFETMIIATIASRDKLKNNLITVKLETEPFLLEMNKNYTVIESKAYFVAYKHTLKALQEIREVPLHKYIVDVKEINARPDYLSESSTFVLSSKINTRLDRTQDRTVCAFDAISKWPLSEELRLDESQRRALYAALTRQMAIIQGPPGTGKTYLGLLITKIILTSKLPKTQSPILVVCYTNHALDQFLRGMLSFTENICRVGSHSQVNVLAPYQINKLLHNSLNTSLRHFDVYFRYGELKNKLKEVRNQIEYISEILEDLEMSGILSVSNFRKKEFTSIVPSHLRPLIFKNSMFDYLRPEFAIGYELSEEDFVMAENNYIEEIKPYQKLADSDDDEDDNDDHFEFTYSISFDVTPWGILQKIKNYNRKIKMDVHNIKTNIYANIEILKQKLMILKEIEKVKVSLQEYKALEAQSHVGPLDFYSRWMMYKFWKSELIKKIREKLSTLQKKYMKLSDSHSSLKELVYLDLMKKADVVGMTTTAAAQYCKILHDLAPPIVVVEEAAEILEAHLVTSLSEKCQHLILIGDHQQLRPKPNVFELAQHYHLDVSFFERMIKNGISYETLEYQHRMRPSISDLLVPTIYENLKDHESVLSHPKIKGVKKDLFFIDHNVYETEQLEETESYENPHEAEFLMGLCLHLIRQGYRSYQVSIITPYLGQCRNDQSLKS
ncbi:NFX1-type zinc finger-containing protein 1 [Armadillidium vulgare]|nr:NFX1-type zinc finger-containing protein 1 [Armadillidium vulgare]